MTTYSIFIPLAYFSQKNMESNNLLAGDGKRVLVRKNENPPYCKSSCSPPPPSTPSPLCSVISVSDSSAHFVAEFLHCSVKSRLSLQPWDTPSRHPRLKTEPIGHTSRGALLVGLCFLIQNYFLFHCIIMKSRRS